jgi:hypothetical protein
MFDRFLTLNRAANVVKGFCIDQSIQAVVLGKSLNKPLPMREGASRRVACAADVENAVAPIGHGINPAALDFQIKARRGWPGRSPGTSPGTAMTA